MHYIANNEFNCYCMVMQLHILLYGKFKPYMFENKSICNIVAIRNNLIYYNVECTFTIHRMVCNHKLHSNFTVFRMVTTINRIVI